MLLKQVAKVPSAIADDKRRGYWRTNGLATRVQNEYAITLHSQLDADIELAESMDLVADRFFGRSLFTDWYSSFRESEQVFEFKFENFTFTFENYMDNKYPWNPQNREELGNIETRLQQSTAKFRETGEL